ncbi:molybdopterin-dependent oxidoreductase [Dyella sp. KRB-257]|uniref:molybdopterin-dependent oxidoreductase n=1 Tax=Dyella sp. KRB-257 TaxID=3400915 RepID=UPI003C00E23B
MSPCRYFLMRRPTAGVFSQPLSLKQLMTEFEPVELAAVNQCSGNSRGLFNPRVAGGQWGNGAMGCAKWTGVRLKDVLDRAGVKPGAVQVRFNGMDSGTLPGTPDFLKSLDLDHARDGEVMIAYGMNGEALPLLNGFPTRLVVPGWFATYWVKMLNDVEVLDKPDDNFWMATAYRIPDTPHASVNPGQTGFKTVPINRLVPRSFITNLSDGSQVPAGHAVAVRGIAFGGDTGLAKVMWSSDGGAHWKEAALEEDYGKYSFRRWNAQFTPSSKGEKELMVKAVNSDGVVQPSTANWNPGGYMRNVIESIKVTVV